MRIRSVLHALRDLCYPGKCVQCAEVCDGASPLCEVCLDQLVHLEEVPHCAACAMTLAYPSAPCPHCQGKGPVLLDRVVRLGPFEDPIKTIIHRVKYNGLWPLGEYLADRLLELEPAKALLSETNLLIPVPLHPLRQIERGYNQAAVIARRLGKRCRIKTAEPVIRLRRTETQTHMHAPTRREANLREAFGLTSAKQVTGKHVVIVDDVYTSGATLRAVARAVRSGAPASVSAVVIGVAEPRSQRK